MTNWTHGVKSKGRPGSWPGHWTGCSCIPGGRGWIERHISENLATDSKQKLKKSYCGLPSKISCKEEVISLYI